LKILVLWWLDNVVATSLCAKVLNVPNHKEIKIGTLGGVLKQAGVSVEDFIAALKS
jgi:hypothetical protein